MLLLLKIGFSVSSKCQAQALFVAGQSQFSQLLEHQANTKVLNWKSKLICKTFEKFPT